MPSTILSRVSVAVHKFKQSFIYTLWKGYPPDAFCLVGVELNRQPQFEPFSIKELVGNGFLWAVPKHRRTVEKRWKRKFGDPSTVWKMLTPRKDLQTCNVCNDDHEAGVLCPTCYKKVIEETRTMQQQIQNELKLEPVEKEVVVLYEGEKNNKPDEYFEGKRIVEMPKPRPEWFSKNLLQETAQKNATTKEVKRSDLG